ncbi:MAG: pyridoxal-phosphate dependent enzyme [Candidatus Eisenbacteria bacterium]
MLEARDILRGVAHRTPVMTSRTLDELLGARVFFKCENFQRMGAFKFRGAYHAIARLDDETRTRGVVAYSSGNHAQAVALVASLAGVPATIVMPSTAPPAKIAATRGYGAEVVFYDQAGEPRESLAKRLATERRSTLVPPFDHPDIISGQGTAALELFEEVGPLDLLVVPVGGGGLISGTALAARHASPDCSVVGVEPEAGKDATASFLLGRLVRRECGETIADGARTPQLSPLTFDILRRCVTAMVPVPDEGILDAMRFLYERMKLVVEPTGALGLAALLMGRTGVSSAIGTQGKGWAPATGGDDRATIGVILSGGNVDLTKLGEWFAERVE